MYFFLLKQLIYQLVWWFVISAVIFRNHDLPSIMIDAFQASSPTFFITLQDSIITALKRMEKLRVGESK